MKETELFQKRLEQNRAVGHRFVFCPPSYSRYSGCPRAPRRAPGPSTITAFQWNKTSQLLIFPLSLVLIL